MSYPTQFILVDSKNEKGSRSIFLHSSFTLLLCRQCHIQVCEKWLKVLCYADIQFAAIYWHKLSLFQSIADDPLEIQQIHLVQCVCISLIVIDCCNNGTWYKLGQKSEIYVEVFGICYEKSVRNMFFHPKYNKTIYWWQKSKHPACSTCLFVITHPAVKRNLRTKWCQFRKYLYWGRCNVLKRQSAVDPSEAI